ncbi:hypothetical protein HU200_003173 [Digitaria exilis]|uniref:Uncharacterized protein n=1 Tax=Digitaria exilis TaxID=1010633 RepID=A0A835KT42_9POAL|nr:hypothetical protein HU200_003173 [Digitaria exilis]
MRPSLVLAPLLLATFLLAALSKPKTTRRLRRRRHRWQSTPPPSPPVVSPPPPATNWTPVADVNDPTIQQVAQFAVRIYALSTTQLRMQLLNVISGETQPVQRRVQLPAGHHGDRRQEDAVRGLRLGYPWDHVVEALVIHKPYTDMHHASIYTRIAFLHSSFQKK